MACPYFYPLARFESSGWIVPPRLPLGDAFAGECRATESVFQPDEEKTRQVCNVGYGRGRCDHFPPDAAADAVRFNLSQDAGALIHIQYIYEKECWPGEQGKLEYSNGAEPDSGNAILSRQATAFVESYLRRRA